MNSARSSGEKTASALLYTGPGIFHGLMVATDATNAVTVNVYDGLTATGTKLCPTWIVTTSAASRMQSLDFDTPVEFYTGCYVDVSVAGGGTCSFVGYTKGL